MTYVLSFSLPKSSDVKAQRRMDLKRCRLAKKRMQSYSVVLHGMLAMAFDLAFKEHIYCSLAQMAQLRRKVCAILNLVRPNLWSRRAKELSKGKDSSKCSPLREVVGRPRRRTKWCLHTSRYLPQGPMFSGEERKSSYHTPSQAPICSIRDGTWSQPMLLFFWTTSIDSNYNF